MDTLRKCLTGLRAHTRLKLGCELALGVWIVVFYFAPQWWPFFEAHPAPALWVDEWIPFQPGWAPFYQSVFLVHTLALWLPRSARAVVRLTALTAAAYAVCIVFFFLYPTLSPRPAENLPLVYWLFISGIDGPRNAFPSLHAALATLAALQLDRCFQSVRASRWLRPAPALWWCGLLYATLATRQHRVLDLIAGIALVAVLAAFYDRRFPAVAPFARGENEPA